LSGKKQADKVFAWTPTAAPQFVCSLARVSRFWIKSALRTCRENWALGEFMESILGKTLGQYQLVEQIGKGGMATVYKAYQPSLSRYVAVKVLPAYYAHEEGFAERFIREAKAIARLDHPNILPVYDFGKEGDISYIVMKYIPAGTLRDKLGRPMSPAQALEIIEQIAGALDNAHEQGILHRDIKPSNILIDSRDWVYLSDFGLAKMVEGSVQLTGSGVGVGTPSYMSPEQGQGQPVDGRTDVYALGVILFEMLTGQVPYEAETPMAVVIKHVTDPVPLPRQMNPNIPETVEQVLLKALAKDREHRFASAGDMAAALRQAVQGLEPGVAMAPIPSDPRLPLPGGRGYPGCQL
jgi:serine/threonine protein kinase